MKKILPFIFLSLFVWVGFGLAEVRGNHPDQLENVTGTMQGASLNAIDIYDEAEQRVRRFVCYEDLRQYHKGDRLRLYYYPSSGVVQMIKKMTVVTTRTQQVPEDLAVRIIVSEAADQGLQGMICVGEVIRNRRSTKGFYGYRANLVQKHSKAVWTMAAKAWALSTQTNYTNGADHFENVRRFGTPRWARHCVKTYEYKDHVFYKEIGRQAGLKGLSIQRDYV